MRQLTSNFLIVVAALAILILPAAAQEANSKATAKIMIKACSQDFYDPLRETCDWWLRGAVEGFQAMEHRKFCFDPQHWPPTEAVRRVFVAWGERNPQDLENLRTVGLIAALAEAYPCPE